MKTVNEIVGEFSNKALAVILVLGAVFLADRIPLLEQNFSAYFTVVGVVALALIGGEYAVDFVKQWLSGSSSIEEEVKLPFPPDTER